jgi:hypothetical protein
MRFDDGVGAVARPIARGSSWTCVRSRAPYFYKKLARVELFQIWKRLFLSHDYRPPLIGRYSPFEAGVKSSQGSTREKGAQEMVPDTSGGLRPYTTLDQNARNDALHRRALLEGASVLAGALVMGVSRNPDGPVYNVFEVL